MQNVVINMCEKFHYDPFRNDRALGNGKSDNNNNNNNENNIHSAWRPVCGSKEIHWERRPENKKAVLSQR